MLSRKNRFSFKGKLPKQILSSKIFNIRYAKNEEGLRVAVVVSKKVDKRATVRNRLKRKFIEAIQEEISAQLPLSLVFYIKKEALEIENFEQEIKSALLKIQNV